MTGFSEAGILKAWEESVQEKALKRTSSLFATDTAGSSKKTSESDDEYGNFYFFNYKVYKV